MTNGIVIALLVLYLSWIFFMIKYVDTDFKIYKVLTVICTFLFCIMVVLGTIYVTSKQKAYVDVIDKLIKENDKLRKFIMNDFSNN